MQPQILISATCHPPSIKNSDRTYAKGQAQILPEAWKHTNARTPVYGPVPLSLDKNLPNKKKPKKRKLPALAIQKQMVTTVDEDTTSLRVPTDNHTSLWSMTLPDPIFTGARSVCGTFSSNVIMGTHARKIAKMRHFWRASEMTRSVPVRTKGKDKDVVKPGIPVGGVRFDADDNRQLPQAVRPPDHPMCVDSEFHDKMRVSTSLHDNAYLAVNNFVSKDVLGQSCFQPRPFHDSLAVDGDETEDEDFEPPVDKLTASCLANERFKYIAFVDGPAITGNLTHSQIIYALQPFIDPPDQNRSNQLKRAKLVYTCINPYRSPSRCPPIEDLKNSTIHPMYTNLTPTTVLWDTQIYRRTDKKDPELPTNNDHPEPSSQAFLYSDENGYNQVLTDSTGIVKTGWDTNCWARDYHSEPESDSGQHCDTELEPPKHEDLASSIFKKPPTENRTTAKLALSNSPINPARSTDHQTLRTRRLKGKIVHWNLPHRADSDTDGASVRNSPAKYIQVQGDIAGDSWWIDRDDWDWRPVV